MVNTTILLLLLIVFSFIISSILKNSKNILISLSGFLYILLGVFIGPQVGLGLISEDSLMHFQPFVSLLIGVVGFILGIRVKDISKDNQLFMSGVTASLVILTLISFVMLGLSTWLIFDPEGLSIGQYYLPFLDSSLGPILINEIHLWISLTLGAAGVACSSMLLIKIKPSEDKNIQNSFFNKLNFLAIVFQIIAILIFGFALSSSRSVEAATGLGISVSEWALVAVASGILVGFLFSLFIGNEQKEDKLFLAVFGGIVFASGIGSVLGISPVFVNLIFGGTLAMTSKHTDLIRDKIEKVLEPIFVMLLLFAGAFWKPVQGMIWAFPIIYFGMRYWIIKIFGEMVFSNMLDTEDRKGLELTSGLMGQDLIAITIGLSFNERFPQWGNIVLSTLLMSVLINQIVGFVYLRRLLLDAGEINLKINLPPQKLESDL